MNNRVTSNAWASAPPEAQKEKGIPEKLIRKAARGNRTALRELCESIARHVAFRVMRKIKSPADVEDVAQEVLLRVCEGIRNLKEPKAFGAWLNTIINNETNRYFTQNKKHGVVISMDEYLDSIVMEDDDDFLAHDYVIKEEERKAVIAVIDTLPERQLEAVILYYYEGMSVTETAKAMGVTKQVISIHLARAKEKIRSVLHNNTENLEKTGTSSSFSALGIGVLISQSLFEEAAIMPILSKAAINSTVIAGIAKADVAMAAAGSVATKSLAKWLLSTVVGMAIVATAVSAINANDVLIYSKNTYDSIVVQPIDTQGDVVFFDGETALNTVNPNYATVWATNDRGELIAHSWWITQKAEEIEAILYRGEGASVDNALRSMVESGRNGTYTLWFDMEDSAGATYTLQRQFTISTEGI